MRVLVPRILTLTYFSTPWHSISVVFENDSRNQPWIQAPNEARSADTRPQSPSREPTLFGNRHLPKIHDDDDDDDAPFLDRHLSWNSECYEWRKLVSERWTFWFLFLLLLLSLQYLLDYSDGTSSRQAVWWVHRQSLSQYKTRSSFHDAPILVMAMRHGSTNHCGFFKVLLSRSLWGYPVN